MNELYELIEKKIKASGYPRPISGADVYDDICDQIDGKEIFRHLHGNAFFHHCKALIRFLKRRLMADIRNIYFIVKGQFSCKKHRFDLFFEKFYTLLLS